MRANRNRVLAYAILSHILYTVLALDTHCEDGYIQRIVWEEGNKMANICCKGVKKNCSLGHYVKKCTSHYDNDECTPCENGKWLFDETNSEFPTSCIDYTCPSGSTMINYIPRFGCSRPCLCDTSIGFYGLDSCNCKIVSKNCPNGTKLALNGSCINNSISDPFIDAKPQILNSFHSNIKDKTNAGVNIPLHKEENFGDASNEETDNQLTINKNNSTTQHFDLQKPKLSKRSWFEEKLTITIIIIIGIVPACFFVIRVRLRNQNSLPSTTISYQNCPLEHATELKDIPLTEVKTLADSGISLTAPEEQNEGIIFKPLLPKEDRPVGRASCFIRNEEEHNGNAETVSNPVQSEEPVLAPSGSRKEYRM